MTSLDSVADVISYVRELAEPFVVGEYVPDWEQRSGMLSAISDYLIIRLRDDAFVDSEPAARQLDCDADTGYRAILAQEVRKFVKRKSLTFPAVELADEKDLPPLKELCLTLDYSEKIVISAAAFAISRLTLSTELVSVVANILFEEAYHLKILTEMLGLDQPSRPWLATDKLANWELVRSCDDGPSYMLLEHLLYEARGGIAAAKGVHDAGLRGVSKRSVAWLEKICNQETNHGISGLVWFGRDYRGARLPLSARSLIRRFIEQECDDQTGTFRTLRQRYSSWLLARYFSGASVQELVVSLKRDVAQCKSTGEIGPNLDEVSWGVDFLYEYLDRDGG
ncbi:MAG: hypothetical protein DMF61_21330 [Blastocatellia bacterium AA13]|nr:MAG: hypothetical protein DMF61_21330 [Blastocatellia bacterium AA13]